MVGVSLGWALGLGLPTLALFLISVSFTRAVRTYSRSRLEEVCEASGRPERADAIAHNDERVERAAEALSTLTGLALAALLGAAATRAVPGMTGELIAAIALGLTALGHVCAGISGRVWAETLLDSGWPLALAIARVMSPATFVARQLETLAYRRVGKGSHNGPRPPSVEVEIHTDHDEDEQFDEADLPETTRSMMERAVELVDRDVSEIMTPRSSIAALPASASAREAARLFVDRGLSRVPLYGEHRDDIVGILYAKDLFARLLDADLESAVLPRKIARPALFVPESKNANELLEELRKQRVQMAIVLDEYGGVAGLITLEDLLEEIVGPIDDEHDIPTPEDPVIELGDSTYEVDAAISLEDLNDRLDLSLPTDGDYQTVGGLAFDSLGRVPEVGETFRVAGVEFTVLQVVDHSIRRLKLDLRPTPASVSP